MYVIVCYLLKLNIYNIIDINNISINININTNTDNIANIVNIDNISFHCTLKAPS